MAAYVLDVLKGKGKGWFPGPPRPGPPPAEPPPPPPVGPVGPAPPVPAPLPAGPIGDKGSYKGTDGCSKGSCKGNDDEPDVTEGKGKGGKMRPLEPAVPPGRPKAKAMPGRSTGQWVQCWMWMPGSGPPYAPCPPSDVIAARPPGPGFGNEVEVEEESPDRPGFTASTAAAADALPPPPGPSSPRAAAEACRRRGSTEKRESEQRKRRNNERKRRSRSSHRRR
ncbi:unnamed protein product [Cladocopium goreaui]|uniref:Uncharacterized protein n=1 Tax=Cladocopium goreaui TaxID=2562237 RepID=A0A9P1GH79_9DINO|nr:unnamed protein product [Cladocopium goreaui]